MIERARGAGWFGEGSIPLPSLGRWQCAQTIDTQREGNGRELKTILIVSRKSIVRVWCGSLGGGRPSPTLEVVLHPRANGRRCVGLWQRARGTTGCHPAFELSRFGG